MAYILAGIRSRVQLDKLDDEEYDASIIDNFINDTQRDIFNECELPFMEKISKEYPPQQLTVLSIETWGNKMNTLKNYQAKHRFTYPFLQGNSDVTKAYNAMGVPRFFVLDKNHVIRKVFNGYDDKNSDNEIKKVIDALL